MHLTSQEISLDYRYMIFAGSLQGNLNKVTVCLLVSILTGILCISISTASILPSLDAKTVPQNIQDKKFVILNFDDNRKSQFSEAKPILDKYGFKATFYVVCKYLDNKKGYMNWTELETLYKEGHDIGSHTMNHDNLSDSSKKSLEYQIGRSKECLQEHGINTTSFAYPFDKGSDNKTVVNVVSKYYELARTASSPLTVLHCDGWKHKSDQTDCSTYTKNGKLQYANKYSIRGWSHDLARKENSYDDLALFDRFVQVVNSQSEYNNDGTIKAIPIIIYHRAGDKGDNYNTDLELFKKEMKYLHDGNFTVLTMSDLAYDKKSNYLFIKSPSPASTGGETTSLVSTVIIAPGSSSQSNTKFYEPQNLTVSKATKVIWKNKDSTLHTVTSGSNEGGDIGTLFDSSHLARGKTFQWTFNEAGTFDYYCTLHPYMTGEVVVS